MTREETKMILQILKGLYPNDFKNKDQDDMKVMLNIWTELLENDDADLIAKSIKIIALNDESPFMPVIAKIRHKAYELTHPSEMTEQDAWNIVYKAVCNSGYNSKEEWEKLPIILQRLVTPQLLREYSQMDSNTLNTVVSSNFMRSFKVRKEEHKKYEMLPDNLKMIGVQLKNIE